MKLRTLPPSLVAFLSCAALALAQTGTLDQVSPTPAGPDSATLNGDSPTLLWQAQVRAGLTGQLEGFTLRLKGAQGSTLATGLRLGPGWNTGALVFQSTITKPTAGIDDVFVDVTSAAVNVVAGQLFVIELQGLNTGTLMLGSYITPASGPPLYAEPLLLNGPWCFSDCGWRIGFKTWVNTGPVPFCFGDGSGTPCPCGNNSPAGAGAGCLHSLGVGGHLGASGSASIGADSFVLLGTVMPNSSTLYFQGTAQQAAGAGSVFGDGLRCAAGSVIRLGTKMNVSGGSQYPEGGDVSVSVKGAAGVGNTRMYQSWFRNAASFCTPSTFNLTNGLVVTWTL